MVAPIPRAALERMLSMEFPRPRVLHFSTGGRARCGWLLLVLLALGVAFGRGGASAAVAQTPPAYQNTPPPGPQLATGDYITTSNRVRTATWEAFDANNPLGEVLYIWTTDRITRAL